MMFAVTILIPGCSNHTQHFGENCMGKSATVRKSSLYTVATNLLEVYIIGMSSETAEIETFGNPFYWFKYLRAHGTHCLHIQRFR